MTGRLNSLWLRLLIGYVTPLVLFLSAALVAYVTIDRLLGALDREQHAQQVFTKAYKLKEGIVSMSAFKHTHHLLATQHLPGAARFQEDFKERRKGVLSDTEALRELVRDDPARLA